MHQSLLSKYLWENAYRDLRRRSIHGLRMVGVEDACDGPKIRLAMVRPIS